MKPCAPKTLPPPFPHPWHKHAVALGSEGLQSLRGLVEGLRARMEAAVHPIGFSMADGTKDPAPLTMEEGEARSMEEGDAAARGAHEAAAPVSAAPSGLAASQSAASASGAGVPPGEVLHMSLSRCGASPMSPFFFLSDALSPSLALSRFSPSPWPSCLSCLLLSPWTLSPFPFSQPSFLPCVSSPFPSLLFQDAPLEVPPSAEPTGGAEGGPGAIQGVSMP